MALIKCPECGKEISDKSEKCIHCGYPLQSEKNNYFTAGGVKLEKSYFINQAIPVGDRIDELRAKTGIDFIEAKKQIKQLELEAGIVKTPQKNIVRCPNCGSTAIQTVNRGYSVLWGFLGSGSPRNVCQKCGHKWKPGT